MSLKEKVIKTAVKGREFIRKDSPQILAGLAVVGYAGCVVSAVGATTRAERLLKNLEEKNTIIDGDKICPWSPTNKEIIKHVWKLYIPTAVLFVASTASLIFSNKISLERQIAIAGLAAMNEDKFKIYQQKVTELVGEKKEGEIKNETVKELASRTPDKTIVTTGKGDVLCYDAYSGRLFNCDVEFMRRVQNDLNVPITLYNEFITLNDFYTAIGLASVKHGDEFGWDIDVPINLHFESYLTEDKRPALYVDYNLARRDRHDMMF